MKSVYGATRIHLGEDLKFILGANYTEIDTLEYKRIKFLHMQVLHITLLLNIQVI